MTLDKISTAVKEFLSEQWYKDAASLDESTSIVLDYYGYQSLLLYVEDKLNLDIDDDTILARQPAGWFVFKGIPEKETIASFCERLMLVCTPVEK